MLKMSPLCEKLLARLQALGITLRYSPVPSPRISLEGCNEQVRMTVRNYLCDHIELIAEIARLSGHVWKNDRGGIITEHERAVWSAVIAPVTAFEELVRDFWLERQAMRHAEGLNWFLTVGIEITPRAFSER